MWNFGLNDHILELLPKDHLFREALRLLSLGLLVFEEQNTDEEVEEEETSDEDKDDEEDGLGGARLVLWPIVSLSHINGLVHDVWPALKRRQNE